MVNDEASQEHQAFNESNWLYDESDTFWSRVKSFDLALDKATHHLARVFFAWLGVFFRVQKTFGDTVSEMLATWVHFDHRHCRLGDRVKHLNQAIGSILTSQKELRSTCRAFRDEPDFQQQTAV